MAALGSKKYRWPLAEIYFKPTTWLKPYSDFGSCGDVFKVMIIQMYYKNIFNSLLVEQCLNQMRSTRVVTIHCTAYTTPQDILHKLLQVSRLFLNIDSCSPAFVYPVDRFFLEFDCRLQLERPSSLSSRSHHAGSLHQRLEYHRPR